MPRLKHQPDATSRRQVEAMAGYGVPEADIAGVLSIDPKTLRKHYRGELDHGHTKANAKVAENLYRKATGDGREAVIAAIFWLKTRAGWKETSVQELSAKIDPIVTIKRYIVDPPTQGAREVLSQRIDAIADRLQPRIIEHIPAGEI